MSWVYGIQCGEFIKIGVAQHIERRLRTLKLYNPLPCSVVLRRAAPDCYWIEKRIHHILRDYSVGREWFKITPDQAREAYKAALADAMIERRRQRDWQAGGWLRYDKRKATELDASRKSETANGLI